MSDDLQPQLEAFQQCVVARDARLAATVLDEDFALVLVQPQRAVMPRARWLEVLNDYVVHDWKVEEQLLDLDGECAIMLQRVRMDATVLGEDRSGLFVMSDIWRKREGTWRVWRRHSTPLTAGNVPGA